MFLCFCYDPPTKHLYVSIQQYRTKEFVTLDEKEKKKYNNKFIFEMPFPKISRQFQEKIIFPGELKRFRYEEVTSLSFIG